MQKMRKKLVLSLSGLALMTSFFFIGSAYYIKHAIDSGPQAQPPATAESIEPLYYFEVGGHSASTPLLEVKPSVQYTVELDVQPTEEAAQRQVKRLNLLGIDCFYTPVEDAGQVVFKIRSGLYQKEDLATKQSKFLSKEFSIKGDVVKL